MNNKVYWFYASPVGTMEICTEDGRLCSLLFSENSAENRLPGTELQLEIVRFLDAYFAGKNPEMNIPLAPQGTDFQQTVWAELLKIPYGTVCSYEDISRRLGS